LTKEVDGVTKIIDPWSKERQGERQSKHIQEV
jgi:hypothetical protein